MNSQIKNKNKNNRRQRRRGQTIDRRINRNLTNAMVTSPFPPVYKTRATFVFPVKLLSSINGYAVIEIRINDGYDPTGTGFSYPGLTTLAIVYRIGRALRTRARFQQANMEVSTPINIAMFFNDTQPSTIVVDHPSAVLYSGSQIATGPRLLAPLSGQNRTTLYLERSMGEILGDSAQYRGSIGYAFTDSASPTQSLWLGLIAYTEDAATFFPTGTTGTLTLDTDFIFYSQRIVP